MSDEEEIEGEGFVFKDSRSSQLSEDEALDQDSQAEANKTDPAKEQAASKPFKIDFSTFIMSLTSSAFYHLGDIADPETGKTETNLPAVQQMVSGPAIFMMVFSIITLVVILFGLIASAIQGGAGIFGDLPPEARARLAFEGVGNIIQLTLALVSNTAILIGAIKMKNLRSYPWAMAASILSILSGCGCCCPIGPAGGIWAIVVLTKPGVKAAFDQTKSMA